ncbi:hypothetical protein [Planktothrix mougeotii]|uniref:Uncharacterized protein n=1 Tax=Planktothrix mougeotii LEGE 06226 TaxID=1828728 RepID=A0ABR9U6K9_9CYAN|nr:hypothetical protein [Planktothrix mougeotii]MBE9142062.1 hypothetical protein [Planktothrix mougeotii LEGE 06226]
MPPEIKMKLSAIKFLPQSEEVEVNQSNSKEQRYRDREERKYLQGIFAGSDEDAKGIARVWFCSDEEIEVAWTIAQEGKGILVVGDYLGEKEMNSGKKTIGLENARIARYDANGKFELTIPGQSEPEILEGNPENLVILEVVGRVVLIQPSMSTSSGSGHQSGLRQRHALRRQQQENQTLS